MDNVVYMKADGKLLFGKKAERKYAAVRAARAKAEANHLKKYGKPIPYCTWDGKPLVRW
jgi:hypothetical protein